MLVQPHSNEETGVPELLLPKAAQHQAALALIQLSQEVRPEIQNQAIKLDTDTKLSDFEKKIEDMDWIRKYGDCAEKNEKYAFARVQSRVAEQRHLVRRVFSHTLLRHEFNAEFLLPLTAFFVLPPPRKNSLHRRWVMQRQTISIS